MLNPAPPPTIETPSERAPGGAPDSVRDLRGRALRELRVSVTDRCNFRCVYCMPAEAYADESRFLPRSALLSFDEIERVVRVFVADLGVRKVRITGGEPLLRPDLPRLVERLSRLAPHVELTLTTNGYLLAEQAAALASAGLQRVTVSLDSLDAAEFAALSGVVPRKLDRVLQGIEAALSAGLSPLKINCVVIRGHNEHALLPLAERFRGTPHIVRFIEYMDVGTENTWSEPQVVGMDEITARIHARFPLQPLAPNYVGEVARRFRYVDGQGEIGVIASVTQPFCGDCQRARLSADGHFLTCLFAPGGTDLRAALRASGNDDQLRATLTDAWQRRTDRYSERRAQERSERVPRRRLEMYRIGG